jgi:colanic acid biosynthesis glycosyl transferase WcaI
LLLNNPPLGDGETQKASRERSSLLFFGIDYGPEMNRTGRYMAGLAEELTSRGHHVEVVAAQLRGRDPRQSKWSCKVEKGVVVRRSPAYLSHSSKLLSRLLQYLSFALLAVLPLLRSIKHKKPDVILSIAPALLAAWVPFLAARIIRVPFWLHVHDPKGELAFVPDHFRLRSPLARWVCSLEEALLKRADHVSYETEEVHDILQAKGLARDRLLTLGSWADAIEAASSVDRARVRRGLGAGGRTLVLHCAEDVSDQDLRIVMATARELRHRRDLVFVVCGDEASREQWEKRSAGFVNVVFRSLAAPADKAALLRVADIHLLPRLNSAGAFGPPAELPNVLASGKPLVAAAGGGTSFAREVLGAGLVITLGDARALARAISRLADDQELAEAFGREGLRRANTRWSLDLAADQFERRLAQVLRERRGSLTAARSAALAAE